MLEEQFDSDPRPRCGIGFEDMLSSLGRYRFFKARRPPSEPFCWRSSVVAGPNIYVWRAQFSADWSLASDTEDEDLGIVHLHAGSGEAAVGGRLFHCTPSTLTIAALPALRRLDMKIGSGECAITAIRFDKTTVAQVMRSMFEGPTLTKIDLLPTVEIATPAGQMIHQTFRAIVSAAQDERNLTGSKTIPLLTEAIVRIIFENVPHRRSERLRLATQDSTPLHVKRAVDYMHANLHLPLTIIDIAGAIGVTERSLQLAFRRFHHTTPVEYLRRTRLEAVHSELSHPQNTLSIREVAQKWGFTHMGRFAAQYHTVYGLYPSETAKRRLDGG